MVFCFVLFGSQLLEKKMKKKNSQSKIFQEKKKEKKEKLTWKKEKHIKKENEKQKHNTEIKAHQHQQGKLVYEHPFSPFCPSS